MSDSKDATPEQVAPIVERIKPRLAGKPRELQAAVLADLLAIWLAGHQVEGDEDATRKWRAELLAAHCSKVRLLTSVNAKIMGTTPCLFLRDEESLLEEVAEAFWGAYEAAPSGEGVMGAAEFGCRAAALAATGTKAPEAVAKAIGEAGHYGVPRKYKLVLREPGDPL